MKYFILICLCATVMITIKLKRQQITVTKTDSLQWRNTMIDGKQSRESCKLITLTMNFIRF